MLWNMLIFIQSQTSTKHVSHAIKIYNHRWTAGMKLSIYNASHINMRGLHKYINDYQYFLLSSICSHELEFLLLLTIILPFRDNTELNEELSILPKQSKWKCGIPVYVRKWSEAIMKVFECGGHGMVVTFLSSRFTIF